MRKPLTLVQMLVVVAILGVVASVLFPVLARARSERREARFERFERVAQAVLAYAVDHDDLAPEYYALSFGGNAYHREDTWVGRVFPYAPRREVFFDPTLAQPIPNFHDAGGDLYADAYYGAKGPTDHYTFRWQWVNTISLNSDGFAMGGSGTCMDSVRYRRPRQVASLDRPEMRLMLAPTQMDRRLGWAYFRSYEAMRPVMGKARPAGFSWNNLVFDARDRWGGRMEAAYADGHVGRFGQEKFVPESVYGHAAYCAYLARKPGLTRFWGEPWSTH